MKKVTALVPMKGHSERIPGKNIRNFVDKPLFFWILNSLKKSRYVSRILIDTDSLDIKRLIFDYFGGSIEILDRPEYLCGDFVSMNEIIKYDISKVEGTFYLQTHATNPLLGTKTIDSAIEKYFDFSRKGFDSLFSVNRYQSRFYNAEFIPINHNPSELVRTQDLPPIFEENSCLYLFSRESFLQAGARIGSRPYLFEMDKIESIDIDEEADFRLAEYIFFKCFKTPIPGNFF